MTRPYHQRRRAVSADETRRRITRAAMELHGTVGPALTTISAVAERAGVQRLTVYRHFPDESALFRACSSQWIAENPPPDISRWLECGPAGTRLHRALTDLYEYFDRTSAMWDRIHRDLPLVEALAAPMAGWRRYQDHAREVLLDGWSGRAVDRERLSVAIGHALAFSTWRSLAGLGCTPASAVALMCGFVAAASRPDPRRRRSPRASASRAPRVRRQFGR